MNRQDFGPDARTSPRNESVIPGPSIPLRERAHYIAFEDLTRPGDRSYGLYLVRVLGSGYSQLITASHPTAARVARSRTQYGEAELAFLEPIDTPALD